MTSPERRSSGRDFSARLGRARSFLARDIWEIEIPSPQYFKRLGVYLFRLAVLVWEGFWKDNLFLRAAALTYHVTFSIVPLLAVMLAVVNMIGGDEVVSSKLKDMILTILAPGGKTQALQKDVVENLERFLDNVQTGGGSGGIGVVGLVVLVYTVVSLLSTIESTFNDIWGIRQGRSIFRKITIYWCIVSLGPILIGSALTVTASFSSSTVMQYVDRIPGVGQVFVFGLPYFFAWLAFGGFYAFTPNTNVSFRSSLIGGVIAGTLWQIGSKLFVLYVSRVMLATKIYGALAAIPVFLFWIYISWAIVLFGAEVAFATQNLRTYRRQVESPIVSPADREVLGLHIMYEVARPFLNGDPPPSSQILEQRLHVPIRVVNDVVFQLTQTGFLRLTTAPEGGLIPGRNVEQISVKDILDALRQYGNHQHVLPDDPEFLRLRELYRRGDRALETELGGVTLRSLLPDPSPAGAPPLPDRRRGEEAD